MTAGELLRAELAAGASQLGLAKRLAGSDDDSDKEVRRWRYVVRRAAAGGEPQRENVKRIGETFAVALDRARPAHVRREELVDEMRRLVVIVDALTGRVEALERLIRSGESPKKGAG